MGLTLSSSYRAFFFLNFIKSLKIYWLSVYGHILEHPPPLTRFLPSVFYYSMLNSSVVATSSLNNLTNRPSIHQHLRIRTGVSREPHTYCCRIECISTRILVDICNGKLHKDLHPPHIHTQQLHHKGLAILINVFKTLFLLL
jgi:hypothetical protein